MGRAPYDGPVRSSYVVLLGCVGAVLTACAQGGTLETGFGGAGGEGFGGSGSGSTGGVTSSSSSASSSSSSGTSTSSSSSTSSTSSSSSTGGPTCDFTAPADCTNAEQLAAIDGDDNHDKRTATGNTSRWFKVEVVESVSSIIDYPSLSYTATLTSPPGASYGLFVYTGGTSGPTCFAAVKQGAGNPAVVSDSWGDTLASDDTTWITVEVRHLSGDACGPSDQWTLTVEGNTN